jgi:glycosyltransferase involved in cell wall biosynthesis
MAKVPVSAVVLTRNEEVNLPVCLAHLADWAGQVLVLDDNSTDRTRTIAREAGVSVTEHPLGNNFVAQRNWALRNLPFENEWVFFIDADEYPTDELKKEVAELIAREPKENGFYMKRRFIFWGKWLKHGGYYPVWILRLMRHKAARCEGMLMDEHFSVDGEAGRLENDIMHDDRRGLKYWFVKHRRYAELKARERAAGRSTEGPTGEDETSKSRAAKRRVWDKLPLFVRPILYWAYCLFVQGGILDGIRGIIYHTLHGFWYPFIIDVNIVRVRRAERSKKE